MNGVQITAAYIVLTIGITCCTQIPDVEVSSNDSELTRDVAGRLQYKDQLFSGYILSYYENGIKSRTGYLNGRKEGKSVGFYRNGSNRFERTYRDGKKDGIHQGWFENSKLKFQYRFEDGLSIGNHKEWYSDGSLFKDLNYRDGRPFGAQRVWRSDGKMRANYVIRENGKRYGLMGIKRCTKLDGEKEDFDPYKGD